MLLTFAAQADSPPENLFGPPSVCPLQALPPVDRSLRFSPSLIEALRVDGPLLPPPILYRLPPVETPGFVPPAHSPGYLRRPARHGPTSPIAPAVVSAHAPPWEQLPSPAELQGGRIQTAPTRNDSHARPAPFSTGDFAPDPFYDHYGWDPVAELDVYGGKHLQRTQQPLLQWGMPIYPNGPVPPSLDFLGPTNLVQPKFYVYGDFRTAIAQNKNVNNEQTVWANRLNLEIDFWLTATERFHMFWGPLDQRNEFTGVVFDGGDAQYVDAWDGWDQRTDTMFFEGDLGYILGGLKGVEAPFNLPFAAGLIPLLFQNGIWMEDAIVGVAATIPARNNPGLDWSNFDTTLFVGFDEITSRAFGADNRAANIVGVTTFIERRGGFFEFGYAFLDDTKNQGRSYHNISASYTRRYLNLVSNSARVIVNTGQAGPRDQRTADGVLLLLENSFLTPMPYNLVPYVNLFVGFNRPQSAARLAGPLKNTGINFESDLLTGFPLLDDSANNTYGGAAGVDLLGHSFEQQLIVEAAFLQAFDDPVGRVAPGDQYAVGVRYQRPLNHTLIVRLDAMHGWLQNSKNISGARVELRRKF